MASFNKLLALVLLVCTVWAQMEPMPGCTLSSSQSSASPLITMWFHPWIAPQIGPTSTVYEYIVTQYNSIIDCTIGGVKVAIISTLQSNPPPHGPFTTKTTVPVLTVTAVVCKTDVTAITRRDIRGYGEIERATTVAPYTKPFGAPADPKPTSQKLPYWLKPFHHLPRPLLNKRQNVSTSLSPGATVLISQLQTAEYGLELCNSGFNLTQTCESLRNPVNIPSLASVGINAQQAGDIVCFCSVYGIDLNSTNAQLLGDMAAAIYGIELGDNFTNSTDTSELCGSINLNAAPSLGVDASAIQEFICGAGTVSVTITSTTTETVIVVPGTPTLTTTASGSAPSGFPNGTFPFPTGAGTGVSIGTAATGAGSPYGNATLAGSDALSIEFPKTTALQGQVNSPLTPSSPRYYPAFTTSTVSTTWGGYY